MNFIKACLALFYLTRILLFEEKDSHFGPFPDETLKIYREANGYIQPVTLFDWVRRLTLNPYQIQGDLWMVDDKKMERWTCPICLSFWVAIPFTILNIFRTKRVDESIVINHFALAAVSAILNYVVNYVQMWSKEEESVIVITDTFSGDMPEL